MDFGARGRVGRVDNEALERENERGLDAMAEKVALLKQATQGIYKEADSHHGILDKMESGMYSVGGLMGSVTDKFKTVMNTPQSCMNVLLVVGGVGLVIVVWYFMQHSHAKQDAAAGA